MGRILEHLAKTLCKGFSSEQVTSKLILKGESREKCWAFQKLNTGLRYKQEYNLFRIVLQFYFNKYLLKWKEQFGNLVYFQQRIPFYIMKYDKINFNKNLKCININFLLVQNCISLTCLFVDSEILDAMILIKIQSYLSCQMISGYNSLLLKQQSSKKKKKIHFVFVTLLNIVSQKLQLQ